MISDLHNSWAWVAILSNALAGVWALAAHKIMPLRTRALWWYTGVAQFTIFVQVTLGVIMVAVAIIYSYRLQLKSRVYLLYGFGGLFLMGLGIRAMLVGQA